MRPGPDSGSGVWYYGQKRGGKSGLIPFPRVGRSGPGTWDLGDQYQREDDQGKTGHSMEKPWLRFYPG